jgi:hypothetical protein
MGGGTVKEQAMTDERLREIEERARNATPGPWTFDGTGHPTYVTQKHGERLGVCVMDGPLESRVPDASFVAHASRDIPDLIAEVKRLRIILQRGESPHDARNTAH